MPGNPLLVEPMYLAGYIEQMGTGTRDMICRCTRAGLPEPEFAVNDGLQTIIRRAHSKETGRAPGESLGKKPGRKPGERSSRDLSIVLPECRSEPWRSYIVDVPGMGTSVYEPCPGVFHCVPDSGITLHALRAGSGPRALRHRFCGQHERGYEAENRKHHQNNQGKGVAQVPLDKAGDDDGARDGHAER